MAVSDRGKLNRLERTLPEGLLVDAAWMERHGYSTSLRSHYVAGGWLTQPVRGTYKRPRGRLTWENVVVSLQTLLGQPLVVGGRTALELQGFGHYLTSGPTIVQLHGLKRPPGWLNRLPIDARFVFRRIDTLFASDPVSRGMTALSHDIETNKGRRADFLEAGALRVHFTGAEWPLTISRPERALLELLDELPSRATFHDVDMIAEGLRTLSPRLLQKLLEDCRSVKVKRLFFWFADRHRPAWLARIDRGRIPLGSGKRMLTKGGRLDPTYLITVPDDLGAPV
jgi:hypothetical protein